MSISTHRIISGDSAQMTTIPDNSVYLIVTSPPYPMIEMWDESFSRQDSSIASSLQNGNGLEAFYKMHAILEKVWAECDRVLIENGFVCINIGDATRTIRGNFQLFSNHTQIINVFLKMGYCILPDIHWRKQSNSPNKFMGSGMYPAGAYVTYEHEYILVFRKGGKRIFKGKEKELRQKSAFFWEERNIWFSDLWDLKGVSQTIQSPKASRDRNASFPFELPYRLVNMYSSEGDTVLDPFAGMGTTSLACMAANRDSISYEIDPTIAELARLNLENAEKDLNHVIDARIQRHLNFIEGLPENTRGRCYKNIPHGFDVKTRQETAIHIDHLSSITRTSDGFECSYK